jgi:threonine dehydrogenase-like Zn-dependent dehydrogenase
MVLEEPRKLVPRELPVPELGDDDALLRVEVCGMCGTDYEQYDGSLRCPADVIPGHEPLGVIDAIGDRAARRWGVDVGDRVAVENLISCRACAACQSGRAHLCRKRKLYSYMPIHEGPGLWGAYSQFLYLHPDSVVHKMDPTLPPAIAALFNPLGAGYRWAVEIPNTKPGDAVVILGPGQRGLGAVLAAREAGASNVIVTGLACDAHKLAVAREFGAHHTIDVQNENARRRIEELTDGAGADVVLDVSSYALEPVVDAIDYAALGGTVVLAGMKGFRPVPNFVSDKLVLKEVSLRGAIGVTSSAYRSAIRLIDSGAAPLDRMHTHDFALAEADRAIHVLRGDVADERAIHCTLLPEH